MASVQPIQSIHRSRHLPANTSLLPIPLSLSTAPIASYPSRKASEVLHLLDILLQIAPFLSLHDLYLCTLVSSSWYKVFNPLLWRAISISESRHEPDFLSNLSHNLRWIHSLQWNYTEWWELHHVVRERSVPSTPTAIATAAATTTTTTTTTTAAASSSSSRSMLLSDKVDTDVQLGELVPAQQSRAHAQHAPYPGSSFSLLPFPPKTPSPPPIMTPRRCSYTGRPIYRAPTPISFPTTATLQALGFENACALQSLVLDGPFELIPLLTALGRSRSEKRQQSLQRLSLKNTNCVRREIVPIDLLLRVSPWLEHCSIRTNAQILTSATATPNASFGNSRGVQTQSLDIDHAHGRPARDYDDVHDGLGIKPSKSAPEPLAPSPPSPLVRLRSLELDIRAMNGVQLMDILVQCPNLESLAIVDYGQISPLQDFRSSYTSSSNGIQSTRAAITPSYDCSPPNFSHDPSPCTNNQHDHRLEKIVDSLPTFLHRNIESVRLGDVALTFLAQQPHYCQQLTALELTQSHTGKIQSRTLQTFLRSATGLKHLRTKGGVTLQVEDMLDSTTHEWVPWACMGLETLSIAFGVTGPSPPMYNNMHSNLDTDHSSSLQSIQHSVQSSDTPSSSSSNGYNAWAEWTVYKQLSLLTQLCVLDIRQSFLRLQTGTGIELLASLTQLREFSIAGSEVGQLAMTREMDKWFKQHWPSIDRIVVASRACTISASIIPSGLSAVGPGIATAVHGDRRRSC